MEGPSTYSCFSSDTENPYTCSWDTTGKEGDYIIYARSTNNEELEGPSDIVPITIDRTQPTKLTFKQNDHLNDALDDGYPAPPITEIVSVSPGDILGYDEYEYTPGESEAYCNNFNPWANLSFKDNILTIRGKSYDPRPYGNITNLRVWITNTKGEIVFEEEINDMEMYFEGEWTTGEKELLGRGGALYYMDDFDKNIVWASNGKYTSQADILNALNQGSGFTFMSGHGSPNSWGDHYPGVPGNRGHGSIGSLTVTNIRPWPPFVQTPIYPIDSLTNGEKLPVMIIGGCHNSQFNVSMILGVRDILSYYFPGLFSEIHMWCHGVPVPECMGWRFVRAADGGAIATVGNTGLGYGMPGKVLTVGGGDGWITIEFFRQYGEHGQTVLGEAHSQTITSYITTFEEDMDDIGAGHAKTVQQWVLLGDPSLQIGGTED